MSRKKAIIYARVSTVRQAEDELPVQSQLDQCRKRAEEMDLDVLKVFTDDGISGRSDVRPAFQDAITYCDTFSVDYFITWSSSRFARNKVDAGFYKRRLEKQNTKLVYVSMSIDTDKTEGWLLDGVMELFDELYSRQIAADTKRSMIKNAQGGFWNGGLPPLGFRVVKSLENPKRKSLVVDEVEASIVAEIFNMKLQGHGARSIAVVLNDANKKNRNRDWNVSSVLLLLRNPTVIGFTVFNKRNRTTKKNRPESEWIKVKSHDPIISEEVFSMVQDMINKEAKSGSSIGKSSHVFTGILHCGLCGSSMQIDTSYSRGKLYSYYNCRRFSRYGDCVGRRIRADLLDDWMISVLCDDVFSDKNLKNIVAELSESAAVWALEKEKKRRLIISQLTDLESRNSRLYELLENPEADINLGDLAPRLRENKNKVKSLESELAELEAAVAPAADVGSIDIDDIRAVLIDAITSTENPKKTRALISKFVTKIFLANDEVRIEYDQSRVIGGGEMLRSRENWLPGPSILRNKLLVLRLPVALRKAS